MGSIQFGLHLFRRFRRHDEILTQTIFRSLSLKQSSPDHHMNPTMAPSLRVISARPALK